MMLQIAWRCDICISFLQSHEGRVIFLKSLSVSTSHVAFTLHTVDTLPDTRVNDPRHRKSCWICVDVKTHVPLARLAIKPSIHPCGSLGINKAGVSSHVIAVWAGIGTRLVSHVSQEASHMIVEYNYWFSEQPSSFFLPCFQIESDTFCCTSILLANALVLQNVKRAPQTTEIWTVASAEGKI